ncbi:hypothetical protein [Endozoicomonas sp.]|uniref:hypothetical protein n=1 Tax=Endozoicomonas sp. TaxID=1892382 RepID=UPI002886C4BD|nr:hypothetical protein [Endozoicomonas sp.]
MSIFMSNIQTGQNNEIIKLGPHNHSEAKEVARAFFHSCKEIAASPNTADIKNNARQRRKMFQEKCTRIRSVKKTETINRLSTKNRTLFSQSKSTHDLSGSQTQRKMPIMGVKMLQRVADKAAKNTDNTHFNSTGSELMVDNPMMGAVEDKSGIPSLGASDEGLTTKMGQFSLSEKVSTNNVNSAPMMLELDSAIAFLQAMIKDMKAHPIRQGQAHSA